MCDDAQPVKKILLVEDDPHLRKHLINLFKPYESRLEVREAKNAKQALENLPPVHSDPPDIVILDIMMPYGGATEELCAESDPRRLRTGISVLEKLRELEKSRQDGTSSIWVAVVTARNDPAVLQKINKLIKGKGCVYSKPFDPEALEIDIMRELGMKVC